jgi:hypothetical protein
MVKSAMPKSHIVLTRHGESYYAMLVPNTPNVFNADPRSGRQIKYQEDIPALQAEWGTDDVGGDWPPPRPR